MMKMTVKSYSEVYYQKLKEDERLAREWMRLDDEEGALTDPFSHAVHRKELANMMIRYLNGERELKDDIFDLLMDDARDILSESICDEIPDNSEKICDDRERAASIRDNTRAMDL